MAEIEEISDTEGGGAQAVGQAGGGHEGGAQGVQVSEAELRLKCPHAQGITSPNQCAGASSEGIHNQDKVRGCHN